MARVGDFDGDGVNDFAIGANGFNSRTGRVVIVKGKASGFGSITLPDTANTIVIDGDPSLVKATFGSSLVGIGHYFGASGTSLIVGSPGSATSATASMGHVYAFHGQAGTAGAIALNTADQLLTGPAAGAQIGTYLSNLGPVIGQFANVGVGNPGDTLDFAGSAGCAFIMSGGASVGPLTNRVVLGQTGTNLVGPVVLGGGLSGADVALSLVGDPTPDVLLVSEQNGNVISIRDGATNPGAASVGQHDADGAGPARPAGGLDHRPERRVADSRHQWGHVPGLRPARRRLSREDRRLLLSRRAESTRPACRCSGTSTGPAPVPLRRRCGRLLGQRVAVATTGEEPVASLSSTRDMDGAAEFDRVFLAADARIDNLDEIRARLGGEQRESSARVLIRAYLAWGDAFPDRLVGDFALVLWDARRRRVLAARDPFGVRPLFYRRSGERLWLASTVAALLPTFDGLPAFDDERICEYLLWRYKSTEATFYRDIREVDAGHVFAATERSTTSTRYWRPPSPRPEAREERAQDLWGEVRRLFVRSVERRLRSGRPVVVHVSGGLDSSSIAMAADQLLGAGSSLAPEMVGASEVFPGLGCDESPFIDAVADAVRFPIERWDGTKSNPIDLVEPALEGPGARVTATSGNDGDIAIARGVGADVILSGFGGDDVMMISGFIRDMIRRGDWGFGSAGHLVGAGTEPAPTGGTPQARRGPVSS